MKEQHRASCPAMFLLLYEKEGKRRGRFLPHPIRASRRGASGRRNKAFQAVGHHVSAGEGPSYLTDVVPPNEETRVCGQWSTTSPSPKAHPTRKTWCFRTKKKGFAGGGAPRPGRRRPIQSERRGASGRRNKALRAVGYHVSAGEGPSGPIDVVPLNEETRVCGQWSTTSRPAKAHPIRKTWCFRTKKQGFAGSGAPRPRRRRLLRYRRILSPARRRVICREYHHSPI